MKTHLLLCRMILLWGEQNDTQRRGSLGKSGGCPLRGFQLCGSGWMGPRAHDLPADSFPGEGPAGSHQCSQEAEERLGGGSGGGSGGSIAAAAQGALTMTL